MTKANKFQDDELSRKMLSLSHLNLSQLNIQPQFWLEDNPSPYSSSIACLQQLPLLKTIDSKLKCLTTTASKICTDVSLYWETKSPTIHREISVGGDELLPLMTYVLLKSNIPNVYSEVAFMELFIDQQKEIEQEGNVLATYHSVISLIDQLVNVPGI